MDASPSLNPLRPVDFPIVVGDDNPVAAWASPAGASDGLLNYQSALFTKLVDDRFMTAAIAPSLLALPVLRRYAARAEVAFHAAGFLHPTRIVWPLQSLTGL